MSQGPWRVKSFTFKTVPAVNVTKQKCIFHFFAIEKATKQSIKGPKRMRNLCSWFYHLLSARLQPKLSPESPAARNMILTLNQGKVRAAKPSCSSKSIINRIRITLGPVDVQQFWWFPIKLAGHEVQVYPSLLLHRLCLRWSIVLTVCLQCNTWQAFSGWKILNWFF